MDLNTLQQYMDFADKNGLFNQYKNSGNGFQPTVFNVPMMEANWARGMAGPSMPNMGQMGQGANYFANLGGPQPGVSIGDNPYTSRVNVLFADPYMQQKPFQPVVQNSLAKYLK